MTREEQIIEAGKTAAEGKEFSVLVNKQHRTMSAYEIGFIEGAEWADQHPHWIPVEERKPQERGHYLVYSQFGDVWLSEWMQDKEGRWDWYVAPICVGIISKVTHWMPLPVPPQQNKKDEQGWIPAPSGSPA